MDRRSWLWRRKSSEKSPGETESSGSISSHSERFSDDQAYSTLVTLSPEVTSKAAPTEVTDVKILTEKLSAAFLDISSKEDLVKQHAKVAEEAVSGWEKAENEVLSLKKHLEAAKQKNSTLENRVSHLDGALKECMRQLRQAREEQEQKIHEAVARKSHEWESRKSELEDKVVDLEAQLRAVKAEAAVSIRTDLHQRLEAVEKENSGLKHELQSRLEELEFRIAERDLSTQAAETASKQHLESIKKVAKLEAECRRLKAIARKVVSASDHRSLTASSVYVESFADSLSDSGERLQAVESDMRKLCGLEMNECEPNRCDSWGSALITELDQFKAEKAVGKNRMVPSKEINLMDDFLEMERLAALPDTESGSSFLEAGPASDQQHVDHSTMKAELEAMIQKNAELEETLDKMEAARLEVEVALTECQKQLETSESRIKEAELEITGLQTQLFLANKSNQEAFEELKAAKTKNEVTESKNRAVQAKVEELNLKISSLEQEIEKERALSAENLAKCGKLEDELTRMKHEDQLQQEAEILHREGVNSELKSKQDKELALAASRFAECQKTIASLGQQLKSLATLEDFLLDSQDSTGPTSEATESPQNGSEPLKLHRSGLNLPKKDSVSSISLNTAITYERSRNGFGKFHPRSKSACRTRNH